METNLFVTGTTTVPNIQQTVQTQPKPCPTCGTCPTCGAKTATHIPYYQGWWYSTPTQWMYTNSGLNEMKQEVSCSAE